MLEWLAGISTEHEEKLRIVLAEEAAAREVSDRLRKFTESSTLQEWDSAEHPRLGTVPNPGWFSNAGSGSLSKSSRPVTTASYSGPREVAAQQVASSKGVGHHWTPVSVVMSGDIKPFLSDEAIQYAMGSYSGPTDPDHNYGTYGGVKHPDYNQHVKKELQLYIKKHSIKKMSVEQMQDFIGLINKGLRANGKVHEEITAFNNAIRATVVDAAKVPTKTEDILASGRRYMKHPRFKLLAAGAIASGLLAEALGQSVEALKVAANSPHYRRALETLQAGDLAKAQRSLIGEDNSLYAEIQHRVSPHAALHFKDQVLKVFKAAAETK